MQDLHLVLGVFSDALETAALETNGETALVATNVTSSLMMQRIEDIYRSLTRFNHLVIDLAQFGEKRNEQSRDALMVKLRELGFAEVDRVYSTSNSDVRHFKHEGTTPQALPGLHHGREALPPQTRIEVPREEPLEAMESRTVANHDRWPLQPPFRHDGGFGWTATLAEELRALTDRDGAVDRSPLRLLEDARQVGIPHVAHVEIRHKGEGRYSFWSDTLYFSTPDGSDPNTNRRRYEVAKKAALRQPAGPLVKSAKPRSSREALIGPLSRG